MKKIFATLLMLCVALAGWSLTPPGAQISSTWDESTGTLTINYQGGDLKKKDLDDIMGRPDQNLGIEGNVQKLVLEGVWANADINSENFQKFVYEKCLGYKPNDTYDGKTLYLDLSACTNLKCKMTGINDAGTLFTYEPLDGTQEVTTTYTYRKETTYTYTYWGDNVVNIPDEDNHNWVGYINPFNNDPNMTAEIRFVDGAWSVVVPAWGNQVITLDLTPSTTWYDITNGEPGVEIVEYVDENSLTATDDPEIFLKEVTETVQVSPFSLSNINGYINGITFPDHANFTFIPQALFSGCSALETVVFPNNIVAIEREAFQNCTALENITWSTGLQYIGLNGENIEKDKGVFQGCTSIDAIDLSNCTNLQVLGRSAFNGTTAATSLTLPSSVEIIGGEAFHGSGLTAVDLSGCTNLWKLEYECFEDCADLETVTFPAGDTFTFLGNDAFHSCTSLGEINMSECTGITEFQSREDDGKTYKTFCNCTALTSVILPPNLTAIPDDTGDGVFYASQAIEYLEFTGSAVYDDCELQNPITIGKNAFFKCENLATIQLSNNVQSIAFQAFHSAAITEIHIPASVEELEEFCFYNCQQLAKVYFDEFDKTLGNCVGAATHIAGAKSAGGQGHGAFEECQHITDVYVNTLAELDCENNAFDQDITWGASDASANFATLHYPKSKIEHYVNMQHYLTDDVVKNPGQFHLWLHTHYDQAQDPYMNGWYEFINSGPIDPDAPEYQDIILRTFSDWEYSYIVPNGIRAYVVNGFTALTEDTYEVTLKRIQVIPAKTGVILYGHPNGQTEDGKNALVMTPVAFAPGEGLPLCRANWGHSSNYVKNYLEPIITADGSAVHIKPYERYNDDPAQPVMYRNFALGRYNVTDYAQSAPLTSNENNYVGFFRMKDRDYASGYAYLRFAGDVDENGQALAADKKEFDVASGGEILVKEDAGDPTNVENPENPAYYCEFNPVDGNVYNMRANPRLNPKGWWDEGQGFTWKEYKKSWGDRTIQFGNTLAAKYFGELEENADGIVKVVVPANINQGDYYTLQGVRVTNPTKGVYIQNGKKVIVK